VGSQGEGKAGEGRGGEGGKLRSQLGEKVVIKAVRDLLPDLAEGGQDGGIVVWRKGRQPHFDLLGCREEEGGKGEVEGGGRGKQSEKIRGKKSIEDRGGTVGNFHQGFLGNSAGNVDAVRVDHKGQIVGKGGLKPKGELEAKAGVSCVKILPLLPLGGRDVKGEGEDEAGELGGGKISGVTVDLKEEVWEACLREREVEAGEGVEEGGEGGGREGV